MTSYDNSYYTYDSSHTMTAGYGSSIKFSNEDNDANLDLNYLVDRYVFNIYTACGLFNYLGQRQSKLVSEIRLGEGADGYYTFEYERDSKGRISKITRYCMDTYHTGYWFNKTEYTIIYDNDLEAVVKY